MRTLQDEIDHAKKSQKTDSAVALTGAFKAAKDAGVFDKVDNPVNHPSHYNNHPSGVECIDIIRHMNFNLGNVIKYIWRAGLKDQQPTIQDLEKAQWYLTDEINRLKKEEANATD